MKPLSIATDMAWRIAYSEAVDIKLLQLVVDNHPLNG